ncbi:MAG: hypothetical protein HY079_12205, partial [Elusimicrobia bacterium]|nr:hypothetical protein [Elusimicrobiota bacterium]
MIKTLRAAALAGFALSLFAAPVRAQIAIRELAAAAGTDAAPLVEHLKISRGRRFVADRVALPRQGKDVLDGCVALDATTIQPMNVKTAAVLVQTCLNNRYRADGTYLVQAKADEAALRIVVTGSIMTGDSVLLDLNSTLAKRQNMLLGFETT